MNVEPQVPQHPLRRTRPPLALFTLILFLAALPHARADWPGFRGPWGDGHADAPGAKPRGLPLHWSETNNLRWKTEIPFRGWSTPVICGGQVWVTTATEDGHDFYALGLDAESGKVLFNEKLFHCDQPEPLGNNVNGYATPSPAIEPGRVYVHFGSYGTACLDTRTARVIWKRDDLPCRHFRGPASSVLLFENLLIVTMDGADVQYQTALDKLTGKTVWKTDRSTKFNDAEGFQGFAKEGDLRKAHSTPLIAVVDGIPQLFIAGAKAAYAYNARTGKELWQVRYIAWSAAPVAVYGNGLVYLSTGLGKSELWAVRTGGEGDVTDSRVAWKVEPSAPKTASPILVNGLLYMLSDDGAVTCLDASTGERVWRERIGGTFAASPIYADGRLYFFNQRGGGTVLKPGRAYEGLATNTLATGMMASPAVEGRALYLRTKTHLYRVEEEPAAAK